MRTLFASFLSVALAASGFAGNRTPEEFAAAVRGAIEAKDAARLEALTFTEGMSDKDREMALKVSQRLFTGGAIEKVTLGPLPEGADFVHVLRGKKIEPTV
jgi:hypothetical protein